MPTFLPAQLAAWTGGQWTSLPAAPLSAFHFDTRQLRAGDVFVAIRTEKRDGHAFLREAKAAGAVAVIVAAADATLDLPQLVVGDPLTAWQTIAREHRRGFRGPVVGISGSAGKTSTKDLLAILLGGADSGVLATEGNLNNHLGVPLMLTRIDPARHRFAVIEAGISAPGEMPPLAAMIEPDVSLITLIAAAHTEELGGLEGVAREKAMLPAATRPTGVAIFSQDTAQYSPFRVLGVRTMVVERAEVVRPAGPEHEKVFFAVSQRAEQTSLALAYGGAAPVTFTCRRVSDGQAQNAVLAICAALWLGVSAELVQARLPRWQAAKLRGEVRRENGRLLYLDCYNANPASMADALATFTAIAPPAEAWLYVIGCMEELGTEGAAYHRALGRSIALRPQDHLLVIGTHSHEVCTGVLEQGDFTRQLQMVSSIEPIAAAVAEWYGAVFVKGSRRYQLEKIIEVQTSLPLSH